MKWNSCDFSHHEISVLLSTAITKLDRAILFKEKVNYLEKNLWLMTWVMTSATTYPAHSFGKGGGGAGNRQSLAAASLVFCSVPHTAKFPPPPTTPGDGPPCVLVTHRAVELPTLFWLLRKPEDPYITSKPMHYNSRINPLNLKLA